MRSMKREPITIYNKVNNGYKRTVVTGIWKQSTEVSFRSQGELPIDTVKVYIEDLSNYVDTKEFGYDGQGWTITLGNERDNTYIVRGHLKFEFNNSSNRELVESIRDFEGKYQYKRANLLKDNSNGVRDIKHLLIIC